MLRPACQPVERAGVGRQLLARSGNIGAVRPRELAYSHPPAGALTICRATPPEPANYLRRECRPIRPQHDAGRNPTGGDRCARFSCGATIAIEAGAKRWVAM
jgi:hypothetical protein